MTEMPPPVSHRETRQMQICAHSVRWDLPLEPEGRNAQCLYMGNDSCGLCVYVYEYNML